MQVPPPTSAHPNQKLPPLWQLAAAFAIVYLGYGLNFLAIKIGIVDSPAFLFAATHVLGAGILLMAAGKVFGISPALPPGGFFRAAVGGFFLFVGGVGLVTEGEKLGVSSGVAAIIKASVPLWVVVLEALRPGGERPGGGMIAGLCCGAAGVVWLIYPRLTSGHEASATKLGILVLLLSALLFAVGTIFIRHHPPAPSVLAGVSWMMVLGGTFLAIAGISSGELSTLSIDFFQPRTLAALAFLLFVHSLGAFTAMNWLLRHLPAGVVTTKFYISPVIAVFAGWLVLHEKVTAGVIAPLVLILAGVAVVFFGESRRQRSKPTNH